MIWCFPSKSVSKHLEVPLREKCSCLWDTTHISPPHKQKRSAFRNFLHAWQLLLETLLRKLLFFFFRTLFITRITLVFKMTLYLRDFHSRHYCFIVENSATVWLVRKQLWLTGENKVSFSINCKSQHFLFASVIHKSIVTDSGKVTANKHSRNFTCSTLRCMCYPYTSHNSPKAPMAINVSNTEKVFQCFMKTICSRQV